MKKPNTRKQLIEAITKIYHYCEFSKQTGYDYAISFKISEADIHPIFDSFWIGSKAQLSLVIGDKFPIIHRIDNTGVNFENFSITKLKKDFLKIILSKLMNHPLLEERIKFMFAFEKYLSEEVEIITGNKFKLDQNGEVQISDKASRFEVFCHKCGTDLSDNDYFVSTRLLREIINKHFKECHY